MRLVKSRRRYTRWVSRSSMRNTAQSLYSVRGTHRGDGKRQHARRRSGKRRNPRASLLSPKTAIVEIMREQGGRLACMTWRGRVSPMKKSTGASSPWQKSLCRQNRTQNQEVAGRFSKISDYYHGLLGFEAGAGDGAMATLIKARGTGLQIVLVSPL